MRQPTDFQDPIHTNRWGALSEEARRLLMKHRGELEALAQALPEHETLDEEEILKVTDLPPAPPLENRKVPVPDSNSRT